MDANVREAIQSYKEMSARHDAETAQWAVKAGFLTTSGESVAPDEFSIVLKSAKKPSRDLDAIIAHMEKSQGFSRHLEYAMFWMRSIYAHWRSEAAVENLMVTLAFVCSLAAFYIGFHRDHDITQYHFSVPLAIAVFILTVGNWWVLFSPKHSRDGCS